MSSNPYQIGPKGRALYQQNYLDGGRGVQRITEASGATNGLLGWLGLNVRLIFAFS